MSVIRLSGRDTPLLRPCQAQEVSEHLEKIRHLLSHTPLLTGDRAGLVDKRGKGRSINAPPCPVQVGGLSDVLADVFSVGEFGGYVAECRFKLRRRRAF